MVYLSNLGDHFPSVKEHGFWDQQETYFQIEALSFACCVTLKSISPMSLLPYLVSGHDIQSIKLFEDCMSNAYKGLFVIIITHQLISKALEMVSGT